MREGVPPGPVGFRDPPAGVLGEGDGDAVGVELEQADHRERLHPRALAPVSPSLRSHPARAFRAFQPIGARRGERALFLPARGRSRAGARHGTRRGARLHRHRAHPPYPLSTCHARQNSQVTPASPGVPRGSRVSPGGRLPS